MDKQTIIAIVVIPLIGIVVVFLIALLHAYVQKLRVQTNSIEDKETRDRVTTYIDWAEKAVEKVVYSLKYTIVDVLKATGQWNGEIGKLILEKAKAQIAADLSNEIKAAILMINNDFGKWSEDLIEFFVGKSKGAATSTTSIPANNPISFEPKPVEDYSTTTDTTEM